MISKSKETKPAKVNELMTKLGNDEIDTDVYEILDQNASTSMQTQINDLKEMRGVAKTCMNAQQVYRSFKIIEIGIRT